MFAPLGYVRFGTLRDTIHEVGKTWLGIDTSRGKLNFLFDKYELDSPRFSEGFTLEIFEFWALSKIFGNQNLDVFVANPSGAISLAGPEFFRAEMSLKDCQWKYPPTQNSSLLFKINSIFNTGIEGLHRTEPPSGYVSKLYWHFNPRTGLIEDRSEILKDACVIEEARAWGYEQAKKDMESFYGFAVCFRENDIPQNQSGLFSLLSLETPKKISAKKPTGRPRKQEAARAAFQKYFPNGKGNASWKEVAQRISQEMGEIVSVQTIKRALKEP